MTAPGASGDASHRLTPMMQQYFGVKDEHPGSIVLFRMGDFFETFYEDAETCARLLDLTLTARSKEKDPVPMAGVPHHAIEGYLARLVNEHRRTVVLVDQVEDPKLAKGLVRREVTRVLTPGTFLDPTQSSRRPSFLAAVAVSRGRRSRTAGAVLGLAALDLATGEFRATTLSDGELTREELFRLEAKEVLHEEDLPAELLGQLGASEGRFVSTTVEVLPSKDDEARLAGLLGDDEATGLRLVLSNEALRAAALIIRYAEHTQLRDASFERKRGGTLGHITELQPYLPGDALVLDSECRAHLELFRSSSGQRDGSLLHELDCAKTAMGGRLVSTWLARPSVDPAEIDDRLDAVEALTKNPSALDEIRRLLDGVYDLDRLIGRVMMARAGPKDLAAIRSSLAGLPAVLDAAARAARGEGGEPSLSVPGVERRVVSRRLETFASADTLASLERRLEEVLVADPPHDLGKGSVFVAGFDAELDEWVRLSEDGKGVLVDLERRERERTGISSLKVRYNRVFGYFIEVTKANLAAVPRDYIRKQTTVNGERYFTEELKQLEERILSADEKRLAREAELYLGLVREVAGYALPLRRLSRVVAELDVLASFAHLAERRDYVRPEIHEGDEIEISEGRHPVIETRSSELEERFVPNDLEIGGERRLMIITGPNMAGKSTIMRQTAQLVVMAQLGCFVPAKRARIGLVDRVFTRVGASDDLSRGRSTFMVEMIETARILRSATARSLVILDEIGRGTSTFDGLSIAWAVAEHLHDRVRARTLFATHYHELTDIARERPGIVNMHVAVKEWNEKIVFLRTLADGPTNKSYGVQVARLAGLPASVLARAKKILSVLEAQELAAVERGDFDAEQSGRPAPQLDLFVRRSAQERLLELLGEELRGLEVDELSPKQAWALIHDWQTRFREEDG